MHHKPTQCAKMWGISQVTKAPDERLVCDIAPDWTISTGFLAFDSYNCIF